MVVLYLGVSLKLLGYMLIGSNLRPLLFAVCIRRTADIRSVVEYMRGNTGEDSSTIDEGKISYQPIHAVIYVLNLTPIDLLYISSGSCRFWLWIISLRLQ